MRWDYLMDGNCNMSVLVQGEEVYIVSLFNMKGTQPNLPFLSASLHIYAPKIHKLK